MATSDNDPGSKVGKKREKKKRKQKERKERKQSKRKDCKGETDADGENTSIEVAPSPSKKKQIQDRVHTGEDHSDIKLPPVNSKLPPEAASSNTTMKQARHPFEADEADHCETPWRAYEDILPVLDQIAASCGKKRKDLVIYDPYYCDGGIKQKLQNLGCHNVINENRDFYHDIGADKIPQHDVVLTNPPYSGEHMEKMLKFLSNNTQEKAEQGGKKSTLIPFLLLLPHYVYTKPYFQEYFQSDARGTMDTNTSRGPPSNELLRQLFYLVPKNNYRYSYEPPSWVSHEGGSTALGRGKTQTAPFPSFWYCHVPSLMPPQVANHQQSAVTAASTWLTRTFGKSGQYHTMARNQNNPALSSRLHYASCTSHLPREFKGEFDVTNKRPNPRARKRAAKNKQQPQNLLNATIPSTAGTGKRKKRRY